MILRWRRQVRYGATAELPERMQAQDPLEDLQRCRRRAQPAWARVMGIHPLERTAWAPWEELPCCQAGRHPSQRAGIAGLARRRLAWNGLEERQTSLEL